MKRYLPFAVLSLLLLCACASGPAPLALENAAGDRLALGMSMEEINALLTMEETDAFHGTNRVLYGEADAPITVIYTEDDTGSQTAGSLTLGLPSGEPAAAGEVPWSIQGITLGSSEEDVRAALGYPTQEIDTLSELSAAYPDHCSILVYHYFSDGTLLAADTGDNDFSLFVLLSEGEVSCLSLFQKGQGPGFDLPQGSALSQTTRGGLS